MVGVTLIGVAIGKQTHRGEMIAETEEAPIGHLCVRIILVAKKINPPETNQGKPDPEECSGSQWIVMRKISAWREILLAV